MHPELDVLAEGIDEDRQDHHDPRRRDDGLHAHAEQHEQGAEFIELFGGKHIEDRQDEHQHKPRQLPEEFGNALVKGGHGDDLREVVVDDPLIQAV